MRTQEEIEKKYEDAKKKLAIWKEKHWGFEHKEETWEGEKAQAQNQYRIWNERVQTLEFVLGIRD